MTEDTDREILGVSSLYLTYSHRGKNSPTYEEFLKTFSTNTEFWNILRIFAHNQILLVLEIDYNPRAQKGKHETTRNPV